MYFAPMEVVRVHPSKRAAAVTEPLMPEELIPIFHVQDGLKTARWYARLSFEIESEHRFAPAMPLYLFLKRGPIHLHLSEHKGDARPGTLVYFWVEDVDAIAQTFGVAVSDQPRAREIKLTDPAGNRIRVGEWRTKTGV